MNIQERRTKFHSAPPTVFVFRKKSDTEFLTGSVYGEAFDAAEIFTRAGSREIMAIFKGGEKHSPQDRAFDFYLPVDIKTGTYPLLVPLEIMFTEYAPAANPTNPYQTYLAHSGELKIDVKNPVYSGSFNANFKNWNGVELNASGTFSFLIE